MLDSTVGTKDGAIFFLFSDLNQVLQTHLTATISQSKQALFAEQSSSGFRVEEHACSSIYLYLQYLPESNKKIDGSEAHNKIHRRVSFHKMQPGT